MIKKLSGIFLSVLLLFTLSSISQARDNTHGKGFPNDPVSERPIGQSSGYSLDATGKFLPVSPTNPQPAEIYGPSGGAISVDSIGVTKALVVHNEDIDVQLINFLMHEETGTTFTLASAASSGDTAITVTNAAGLSVGDRLEITEGQNIQFSLPIITNIATNTLTLDGPLDDDYTVAATVELVETNMAVLGTLGSPVSYVIKPHASDIWHLTRLNFSMVHKSAAADNLFGSLAALTNGVVLRSHTALNGILTLANWKNNQQFKEDMFDVIYSDKAGPTLFGTSGRWSFKQRTDTIIRLDGAQGDFLEVLVQDDLTATSNEISDFQIKMQGHIDEVPD